MKGIHKTTRLDTNIVLFDDSHSPSPHAPTQGWVTQDFLDSIGQTVHITLVDEEAIGPVTN